VHAAVDVERLVHDAYPALAETADDAKACRERYLGHVVSSSVAAVGMSTRRTRVSATLRLRTFRALCMKVAEWVGMRAISCSMHGPLAAPGRALVSGVLLAALTLLPSVARATVCTLPSDCFSVGEVCNLGICTPCGSNFTDGGLNGGLLSCQDTALPICDVPDGSVGGQCVQCTENGNCSDGATCDQATQTCVGGDAGSGDAGIQDAGEGDGSSSDAGEVDASPHDAGDGETDATAPTDAASSSDGAAENTDGASENGDGASGEDAAGPLADGASPGEDASGSTSEDGSSEDASGEGGSSLGDGAYVEGGGCACNEIGGNGSMGGAVLAFIVALAGIRRRRSR